MRLAVKRRNPAGKIRVLGVVPGVSVITYVGLIEPMSYLAAQGKIKWNLISEKKLTNKNISCNDVIIFQRTLNPRMLKFISQARKLGKKVIYDIDDNFFAIRDIGLSNKHPFCWPSTRRTYREIIAASNLVRAGSSYLARELSKYNRNVIQLPYTVDFSVFSGLSRRERNEDQLIIGYAGTIKIKDFGPVVPALLQILNEYGSKVILEFMGYVPDLLAKHPQVRFVPFNFNYHGFLQQFWQRSWDIGLAPLVNNCFNYSKSDIKYREYGAMEVAGIYARIPAYEACVSNGINGLLINNTPDEWYQALKLLIENSKLRQEIITNAVQDVKTRYAIDVGALAWEQVLARLGTGNFVRRAGRRRLLAGNRRRKVKSPKVSGIKSGIRKRKLIKVTNRKTIIQVRTKRKVKTKRV